MNEKIYKIKKKTVSNHSTDGKQGQNRILRLKVFINVL